MSILSFFGRLLIATALVSSAFVHYQHPERSMKEFSANYEILDGLSNKYLEVDIPYDGTNWAKIVQIFGGFEALVAVLVLSGDNFGGVAYLISLLVETFFLVWPKIETNSLHKLNAWRSSERQEATRLLCLIGVSMVLSCVKSKPAEVSAEKKNK